MKGKVRYLKKNNNYLFVHLDNEYLGAVPKPNPVNGAWNMLTLGSWGKCVLEEMQPRYNLGVSLKSLLIP